MPTIGTLSYHLVAKTDAFKQGLNASSRALRDQKRLFLDTRTPVERYGLAIRRLEDLHREGKISTDVYTRSLQKLKVEMRDAGVGFAGRIHRGRQALNASAAASRIATAAYAGIALAIGDTVRRTAQFEQTLAESTAIMSDVTDDVRTRMTTTAQLVAFQTKFSSKEAAEAYFFLASAGLSAEESIKGIAITSRFAQAGNFDLATATDLLTDAQSALGLSVEDTQTNMLNMTRVGDVLVKANTLANASVQQFSEALTTRAGAAMRQMGIDVEEGAAVLAVFADQGIKGAEAGQAYSIVLRDLTTKALENADAFRDANIAVFDGAGELRRMPEIVADLSARLDGLSDAQQKATLLQLGFTDKSLGFLQALIGTSEKMEGYEAQLNKAGGTMQDVADKSMTPLTRVMNELSATWEAFALTVGPMILGPLGDFFGASEKGSAEVSTFVHVLAFLADGFQLVGQGIERATIHVGYFRDVFTKGITEAGEIFKQRNKDLDMRMFVDESVGEAFIRKMQDIKEAQAAADRERAVAAERTKRTDSEEIERYSEKLVREEMLAKAKEDAAKAAAKQVETDKRAAESITTQFMTEAERLEGKRAEIERLFQQGLISDVTAQRFFEDMFGKTADVATEMVARPTTIQAVEAGSIEALRIQTGNVSPAERTAKSAEQLAKTEVEALKVQRQLLQASQATVQILSNGGLPGAPLSAEEA